MIMGLRCCDGEDVEDAVPVGDSCWTLLRDLLLFLEADDEEDPEEKTLEPDGGGIISLSFSPDCKDCFRFVSVCMNSQ